MNGSGSSLRRPLNLWVEDGLILKEIQINDAESIFNIIDQQRDYLREWLPFIDYTWHIGDTRAYIYSVYDKPYGHRDMVFSIWYQGKIVGLIGLKGTDRDNHKTEIGYWLSNDQQGKGIVTKSCHRLVQYLFENMGMNRIQIRVGTSNEKSKKIPKRLGFKFEGIERCGELLQSGYTDLDIYSMIRSEFV
ncbi:MAG: GNAT family protein [Bacteroidota bacterium]|nr:GNAT family protein [Bacteroidota bacterium]